VRLTIFLSIFTFLPHIDHCSFVNAFGVFQSYLKTYVYLEKTDSDISWIGRLVFLFLDLSTLFFFPRRLLLTPFSVDSVQLCLFFLMALVAGPLFDKGHFYLLIRLGSAMWITSYVILLLQPLTPH
jgi:hypothetical protein